MKHRLYEAKTIGRPQAAHTEISVEISTGQDSAGEPVQSVANCDQFPTGIIDPKTYIY